MNKDLLAACRFLVLCFITLGALPVVASGGSKAGPVEGVNYIAITLALVVNYGGPGKARFIKAELSLRAENAADATVIMHHLPLIRDKLISILSAQTEEVISTPEGKETLRIHALAEINKVIHIVEHGEEEPEVAEETTADGDKKAEKNKKSAKDKDKTKEKDKKVAKDKKSEKDKKAEAKKAKESSADSEEEHKKPVGPASDLLFNNFVVQK